MSIEIKKLESTLSSFGKIRKLSLSELKLRGWQIEMKRDIIDILNKKKLMICRN